MRREAIGGCELYQGTMEETIGGIQRADCILTDPPYLYIKTHDFDKEFDEQLFFENAKRLLPDDGFIALFGRGTSFYRWNTRLADLGFVFKEEIVWDKHYLTSPCMALSRIHETISIHTKKIGKIRRTKVPYIEQRQYDIGGIVNDIKRIKSAINTEAGLNTILAFLQSGELYTENRTSKHNVSQQPGIKNPDRATACINSIANGMKECSIIHHSQVNNGSGLAVPKDFPQQHRYITAIQSVTNGMREKSILSLKNVHLNNSHPTEKPVRLAERILALISDPGDTIYDPFMGSGSFGVACINTGRKYIGSEMKPEFFDIACKRIKTAAAQGVLDFT